jgi:CRP-like cAMP-binding protein
MVKHNFYRFIDNMYMTSTADKEVLYTIFEKRIIKKGANFSVAGNVSTEIAFLESGIFRHFRNIADGGEHTFYFTIAHDFFSDLESFIGNFKSDTTIQAITDCEIMVCDALELATVVQNNMGLAPLFQLFISRASRLSIEIMQDMVTLSPEERYAKLLQTKPEIIQHSPSKYVASFLGIEPESLSRIKKRIQTN